MIHLCLLLCCVYVVLCWFFTSLVYVRLLASDLVPIDEALWVYLSHGPLTPKQRIANCFLRLPMHQLSKMRNQSPKNLTHEFSRVFSADIGGFSAEFSENSRAKGFTHTKEDEC